MRTTTVRFCAFMTSFVGINSELLRTKTVRFCTPLSKLPSALLIVSLIRTWWHRWHLSKDRFRLLFFFRPTAVLRRLFFQACARRCAASSARYNSVSEYKGHFYTNMQYKRWLCLGTEWYLFFSSAPKGKKKTRLLLIAQRLLISNSIPLA